MYPVPHSWSAKNKTGCWAVGNLIMTFLWMASSWTKLIPLPPPKPSRHTLYISIKSKNVKMFTFGEIWTKFHLDQFGVTPGMRNLELVRTKQQRCSSCSLRCTWHQCSNRLHPQTEHPSCMFHTSHWRAPSRSPLPSPQGDSSEQHPSPPFPPLHLAERQSSPSVKVVPFAGMAAIYQKVNFEMLKCFWITRVTRVTIYIKKCGG